MPTKKTIEEVKDNEIKETNETDKLKNENEELKNKNQELESKVSKIEQMLQDFMEQQAQNKVKMEEETTTVENEEESYFKEIPLNKRIKVMSLTHGGLNLKVDNKASLRFNNFGDVRHPSYEDLQSIISNHPNLTKTGAFFIFDKDVIKNEYLEDAYKQIINRDKMEEIMSLSKKGIGEVYNSLTSTQQEALLSFVVAGIANEDPKYGDLNKIKVISDLSGKDLYALSQNYNA